MVLILCGRLALEVNADLICRIQHSSTTVQASEMMSMATRSSNEGKKPGSSPCCSRIPCTQLVVKSFCWES